MVLQSRNWGLRRDKERNIQSPKPELLEIRNPMPEFESSVRLAVTAFIEPGCSVCFSILFFLFPLRALWSLLIHNGSLFHLRQRSGSCQRNGRTATGFPQVRQQESSEDQLLEKMLQTGSVS